MSIIVVGGIFATASYLHQRHVTALVCSKDAPSTSKGGHQYRVYTSDGTFKVADTIFGARFNSADVYGRIQPGHTYDFVVRGWRFGLTSSFPNIMKYHTSTQVIPQSACG